jgi:hypothetical protein
MAAEMRAAGIIAGFCPKGAKDAKAAFGARDLLGPRGAGGSCNLRDHFRILGNFNGLQAEKFRIAQAGAARVQHRAFTVAVQNISAHGPKDKMEAIKKSTATVTVVTASCHRTKHPSRPAGDVAK